MTRHYVTFGQAHTHRINGQTFDADCVAVFEADNNWEGRQKAFELFGTKFSFEYHGEEFDQSSMRFYSRGFIEVEPIQRPDPAANYAPNTEIKAHDDYVCLKHWADVEDMSRLRALVDGMAPSWNKVEALAALQRIKSSLEHH